MVKNKVCGIGINDADYSVLRKEGKRVVWRCPYYARWNRLLEVAKKRGYSVIPPWQYFSNFRQWLINEGYDSTKAVAILAPRLNDKNLFVLTVAVVTKEHAKYLNSISRSKTGLLWVTEGKKGYVGNVSLLYPEKHRMIHRGNSPLDIHLQCLQDKQKDVENMAYSYPETSGAYAVLRQLSFLMKDKIELREVYSPDAF